MGIVAVISNILWNTDKGHKINASVDILDFSFWSEQVT